MLKGYFKFKYMTLYFFPKNLHLNFLTKRAARTLHVQPKLVIFTNLRGKNAKIVFGWHILPNSIIF